MTTENQPTGWTNPYTDIESNTPEWMRMSFNVARNDVYKIRTVLPDHGGLLIAVNLFIKHLHDHVNANNLTIADRNAFITHVLERCSSNFVAGQGPNDNDGQRARPIRKRSPGKANVTAVSAGEQTPTHVVD